LERQRSEKEDKHGARLAAYYASADAFLDLPLVSFDIQWTGTVRDLFRHEHEKLLRESDEARRMGREKEGGKLCNEAWETDDRLKTARRLLGRCQNRAWRGLDPKAETQHVTETRRMVSEHMTVLRALKEQARALATILGERHSDWFLAYGTESPAYRELCHRADEDVRQLQSQITAWSHADGGTLPARFVDTAETQEQRDARLAEEMEKTALAAQADAWQQRKGSDLLLGEPLFALVAAAIVESEARRQEKLTQSTQPPPGLVKGVNRFLAEFFEKEGRPSAGKGHHALNEQVSRLRGLMKLGAIPPSVLQSLRQAAELFPALARLLPKPRKPRKPTAKS